MGVRLRAGVGAGAGARPGPEACAALLLLCWLCCWPDDSNSDTSSSEYPREPVLVEAGSRRRSGQPLGRRGAASATSLHLPGTSGYEKQPLSAHRSHEEIRSRRKSHHEPSSDAETRYHSAPSVIDEVIHRRDWERSTRDLYIPLNPDNELAKSESSPSLEIAPYAEPESSSIEGLKPDEHKPRKLCKKHYTNIKSSKGKKCKESNRDDIKDTDATETLELSNFYIGDGHEDSSLLTKASSLNPEDSAIMTRASTSNYDDLVEYERLSEERNRSIYKVKEAKQSFNESIRLKEKPRKSLVPVTEGEVRFGFCLDEDVDASDRSGAVHHSIESRTSLRHYPPPSVETVGYDGGACYLAETGSVWELRARMADAAPALAARDVSAALGALHAVTSPPRGLRARHASDGDILAPPHRPESGAFSESDLDLELESEERPPPYDELQPPSPAHRETAI